MPLKLRAVLFASLFALAPVGLAAAPPAYAQSEADVSFDSFHDELSAYGDWFYSDRWGEVWQPADVDRDWRPYTEGHWAETYEYGWLWVSDEGPWSDVVYHYGRWVYDPEDGWLWIPGYVWSPAWVVWRGDDDYTGWMPMPPDRAFLEGPSYGVSISFGDWGDTDDCYGYRRWYGPDFDRARFASLWIFVSSDHIWARDYRGFALAPPRALNVIDRSRNVTNYTVINNVIVNRSVNFGHPHGGGWGAHHPDHARNVMRTAHWVAPVDRGARVQREMWQAHPHGAGAPQSAPLPGPAQTERLSTRPVRHGGPGPQHLFNRDDLSRWQGHGQPDMPSPDNRKWKEREDLPHRGPPRDVEFGPPRMPSEDAGPPPAPRHHETLQPQGQGHPEFHAGPPPQHHGPPVNVAPPHQGPPPNAGNKGHPPGHHGNKDHDDRP